MRNLITLSLLILLTVSCAVVRPGEAAMKQKLGELDNKVTTKKQSGLIHLLPVL